MFDLSPAHQTLLALHKDRTHPLLRTSYQLLTTERVHGTTSVGEFQAVQCAAGLLGTLRCRFARVYQKQYKPLLASF